MPDDVVVDNQNICQTISGDVNELDVRIAEVTMERVHDRLKWCPSGERIKFIEAGHRGIKDGEVKQAIPS